LSSCRWCAATTIPMPPTPTTLSTRNFPDSASPCAPGPEVARDDGTDRVSAVTRIVGGVETRRAPSAYRTRSYPLRNRAPVVTTTPSLCSLRHKLSSRDNHVYIAVHLA